LIREKEGKEVFLGGGEESYGYMPADFVRDKDAIASCTVLAEAAAWAKDRDMTLFDLLDQIYLQFGLYREHLISITKKGKTGAEEIQAIMHKLREQMPKEILGQKVVQVVDVQGGTDTDHSKGTVKKLDLSPSNVLQFYLADGTKVSARPSGTEPKIKFYISVKASVGSLDDIAAKEATLQSTIKAISAYLHEQL
jgi:phosphoglucomutase